MDIELLRTHLLAMRGISETFPFDQETLVFKVHGKMFAALALEKPDRVVLKCDPAYAQELRCHFGGIQEAHHFNKANWNEVLFYSDVPDALLFHLVRHAYAVVLHRLPKKAQIAFFAESLPTALTYRHLNVCDSTQRQIRAEESKIPAVSPAQGPAQSVCALLDTDLQRQGHGQRGTHWESENGKNLLFSLLIRPSGLAAGQQFRLSQAAALALHDTVREALYPTCCNAEELSLLTIKWPNDLYHGDRKLAGMLLEHDLAGGYIERTFLGIGLNVNQAIFRSDAPNPVSLLNICGYEHNRFLLLEAFLRHFSHYLSTYLTPHGETGEKLSELYLSRLYRRTDFHTFQDGQGAFQARVSNVLPDGRLQLQRRDGILRSYYFKEVQYVL